VTAVLAAHELGRWYGQVVGLNDLTTEVGPGITGLLGPNGAGKSTFLKLIAGEIKPSRGTVRVLGEDPFGNRELYRRIGFAPQQDALYEGMGALEQVTFLLRLTGFEARPAREKAALALQRVGLDPGLRRRVKTYSKGMRQRTKLAQAIAHGPELLVLDEPMTGLDPIGRRDMQVLFRALADEGSHVILSSHVLHEVETLTEEILVVHRGRLLAQGRVREVRALLQRHPMRIEVRARAPRELARALLTLDEVVSVQLGQGDGLVRLEASDAARFFERATSLVAEGSFGIQSLESVDAGLEAVFDYLTTNR
jgi:ABC-2 type transport system ATP-binding protein